MAGASGSVTVPVGGGFSATLAVAWEETVGSGYSDLAVKVTFSRSGGQMGGTWYANDTGSITVNGEPVWSWSKNNTSLDVPISAGESILATKTVRVEHTGPVEVPIHVDSVGWYNPSYSSNGCSWNAKSGTAALGASQIYTLTITKDENTNVTVTRAGVAVVSGSGLAAGDVLTVTGTATNGYLLVLKINGENVTSGTTVTVSGDVSVSASAMKAGAQYVRYVPYIGMPDGWKPL